MDLKKYETAISNTDSLIFGGKVIAINGMLIESSGPSVMLGEICRIVYKNYDILAEVVKINEARVYLMPFEAVYELEIGASVFSTGEILSVTVSRALLGRVINAVAVPIDSHGSIEHSTDIHAKRMSVFNTNYTFMQRKMEEQIYTGVQAIDSCLAIAKGQRLGIFSGAGVGKTTLLGMIARNSMSDVNVIALIGERSREVLEFIEDELGEEGLERSIIIVSSSHDTPIARVRGMFVATSIAEYFADQGQDVMFLCDSITRFARAQREIGLSIGEAPALRGFPPSVFSLLPVVLERAGLKSNGSITGFYTVLVDGDDIDEPISDNIRGILDGHIILNRKIAERGYYPAIDILQSISRLANKIQTKEVQELASNIRRYLSVYKDNEDLISIGAYQKGNNSILDAAIEYLPKIERFLQQAIDTRGLFADELLHEMQEMFV